MTWMDNFTQATVIMCLGMGLVFLFVSALVVLIQLSGRLLSARVAAEEAEQAASAAAPEGAVVAAIAMALRQRHS